MSPFALRPLRRAILPVAAVFLLDQFTKLWVERALPLGETVRVSPFFSLCHVQNTGGAFGMFARSNAMFIGLTMVILALLAKMHRDLSAQGPWARRGVGLVWAGALGNVMDRLRHGAVTDFLDVHWRGWHWPAFNVADSAISVGVVCLLVQHVSPRSKAGAG